MLTPHASLGDITRKHAYFCADESGKCFAICMICLHPMHPPAMLTRKSAHSCADVSGKYFVSRRMRNPPSAAMDEATQERL